MFYEGSVCLPASWLMLRLRDRAASYPPFSGDFVPFLSQRQSFVEALDSRSLKLCGPNTLIEVTNVAGKESKPQGLELHVNDASI